jgi:S1-C subfamily serine protease
MNMAPYQVGIAKGLVTKFIERTKQAKIPKERDRAIAESLKSTGSGFFISDDGSLVTNFHVVEGASRVVVKTKQGIFSAKVVKLDPVNDIAVLKVSRSGFRSLPLIPSRAVKLGESVFTIGFPNPDLQGVEPKLTDGKVSSLAGAQDDARHFQISVAVQPGNSGGALVNSVGNVVGIVTARLSDMAALKTTGALPQNVNYAIKSSYVLSLLESVPELAGKIKEPWPAKERKFEDVVKEAQEASALVLAY